MFTPGLENYGYGWGIRTKPIGPGKAERLTIGHGGGINGFSTLITRVPEDRQLVVLLNNTGGTNLDAISSRYHRHPARTHAAAGPAPGLRRCSTRRSSSRASRRRVAPLPRDQGERGPRSSISASPS